MLQNDLGLFFGIQILFFLAVPSVVMVWRLILGWKDGFMTMFKAPKGRMGISKRSPASALRFFLFDQTNYGYYMDVTQAVFSAISCIMFIAVAYSAYDPTSVQVRCSSRAATGGGSALLPNCPQRLHGTAQQARLSPTNTTPHPAGH
jgi:hypothetical protein